MAGYPPGVKNDEEWMATFAQIHDPLEALKLIVENQDYFGHDPYYRDIRAAVLGVANYAGRVHLRPRTTKEVAMLHYYVNALNLAGFGAITLLVVGIALLPSRLRAVKGNLRVEP